MARKTVVAATGLSGTNELRSPTPIFGRSPSRRRAASTIAGSAAIPVYARARAITRLGDERRVRERESEQMLPEATVATGEVEHLVSRAQRSTERRDQLGAVVEVGARVRVVGVRPVLVLARVLVFLGRHSRASVSGCLRTKRAMLRACQRELRETNRLSVTCAQSCVTRAAGTHQRSHPARIAR